MQIYLRPENILFEALARAYLSVHLGSLPPPPPPNTKKLATQLPIPIEVITLICFCLLACQLVPPKNEDPV